MNNARRIHNHIVAESVIMSFSWMDPHMNSSEEMAIAVSPPWQNTQMERTEQEFNNNKYYSGQTVVGWGGGDEEFLQRLNLGDFFYTSLEIVMYVCSSQ